MIFKNMNICGHSSLNQNVFELESLLIEWNAKKRKREDKQRVRAKTRKRNIFVFAKNRTNESEKGGGEDKKVEKNMKNKVKNNQKFKQIGCCKSFFCLSFSSQKEERKWKRKKKEQKDLHYFSWGRTKRHTQTANPTRKYGNDAQFHVDKGM